MGQPYEIVPASVRHIKPMSAKLRAAACITLQSFGMEPRRALHRAFLTSAYCRTALIEGQPVAMWGVKGGLLAEEVLLWLVIAEDITHLPVTIVREAKAELARIMESCEEAAITVLPDDEAAIRFAIYLGFHDRDNDDHHLSRKELCRAALADPLYRIPVGDSYVIALGYHPEVRH